MAQNPLISLSCSRGVLVVRYPFSVFRFIASG